jgi:1-acyl-sn-glycerol-3-phosphate acyltransferase
MLVGHHDGGYIPVDGIVLGAAWHARFQYQRPLIWLMHDFPFRLSEKLTGFLSRCGCRPASRASMQYAFERKQSLVVYPGGAWEAFRPYRKRREIDLGQRTGFVAESLKHRVPIVPIVSVGAHETLFVLARGNKLTQWLSPIFKKFRSDVAPLWIGLPWGLGFGPLPHLPLPAQITVEALEPVRLWDELGSGAEPDDPLVRNAGLEIVRGRMQAALDRLYAARRFPIIG